MRNSSGWRFAPGLLAGALFAVPALAQDSTIAAPQASVVADTGALHPGGMNYFFRSLAVPGWGQASLGRKLTGGLFIGFEGVALGMMLKAGNELHYLDVTDSSTAVARRAERQDWLVLLAFNHLFSALEAYVSAHLVNFPRDLHLRMLPGARPGLGVTIGVPRGE